MRSLVLPALALLFIHQFLTFLLERAPIFDNLLSAEECSLTVSVRLELAILLTPDHDDLLQILVWEATTVVHALP